MVGSLDNAISSHVLHKLVSPQTQALIKRAEENSFVGFIVCFKRTGLIVSLQSGIFYLVSFCKKNRPLKYFKSFFFIAHIHYLS